VKSTLRPVAPVAESQSVMVVSNSVEVARVTMGDSG
jgi:hypothetical protein